MSLKKNRKKMSQQLKILFDISTRTNTSSFHNYHLDKVRLFLIDQRKKRKMSVSDVIQQNDPSQPANQSQPSILAPSFNNTIQSLNSDTENEPLASRSSNAESILNRSIEIEDGVGEIDCAISHDSE